MSAIDKAEPMCPTFARLDSSMMIRRILLERTDGCAVMEVRTLTALRRPARNGDRPRPRLGYLFDSVLQSVVVQGNPCLKSSH